MKSMTGFGRGSHQAGGRRFTVEVRSVNHRYLDTKVRLPWPDVVVESQVGDAIRGLVRRGRVEVVVREGGAGPSQRLLDREQARTIYARLTSVVEELGLDEPVRLKHVVAALGATADAAAEDAELDDRWSLVKPALDEALAALERMRVREGEILARDLGARADHVRALGASIRQRVPAAVAEAATRLEERVGRLLGSLPAAAALDPARLAQEIAILADRTDISEELTRLESHLEQLADALRSEEPVGRQLDFLLQELGREVNTIGSKSQDAAIARIVVELKGELEKMREQVQNVE